MSGKWQITYLYIYYNFLMSDRSGTGNYWDDRFRKEGRIWGTEPSLTAGRAGVLFASYGVVSVLVPGSGYGRNSGFLARSGFKVTGIEISAEALRLAKADNPDVPYVPGSFPDVQVAPETFDAIYCFNVLHLFGQRDRERFMHKSLQILRDGGVGFFTVFSELESSFGKGPMTEYNTFESKPGRPVHYFTAEDLAGHFRDFEVLETGIMEDPECHGDEGPHVHKVRYIFARKR